MAASQKLYHNPSLATAVKNWSWVGENVGYGPSVASLQSAFMASPGHRANILDHQFTQVGVGAVTVNGTIWVSVVFRRPMHVTSTPSKPKPRSTPQSGVPARAVRPPIAARVVVTPARVPVAALPKGVRCSANALAAKQILGLAGEDHSVRLVAQSLRLVLGYQCGKGLPMTGLLDHGTLHALGV